jgi:Fatty acid desaturase
VIAGTLSRAKGDTLLVMLACAHAAVLMGAPAAPVIAIGLWWNANTISHCFIHRPFFRRRGANRAFAAYLSVLLGFPHSLWRDRHLAHHAGVAARPRLSRDLVMQAALVLASWSVMLIAAPLFFLSVYLPGWAAGLLLCGVHGYYEHAHGTTSHYGRLYNLLLFNDGFHVEHHAHPSAHWTRLPAHHDSRARVSRWPAPIRWLEGDGLILLERLALRTPIVQRFLLRTHEGAFRRLLTRGSGLEGTAPRIAIVGGGLFPRTALVLRRILPHARLTIIDANLAHLNAAREWPIGGDVEFIHERFPAGYLPGSEGDTRPLGAQAFPPPLAGNSGELRRDLAEARSAKAGRPANGRVEGSPEGLRYVPIARSAAFDLVVFPLSFEGDRDALYDRPPAPTVIIHDWLWRKRGVSGIVSVALLKRLNLVRG